MAAANHLHARSVGWLIDAPLSITSVTSACGSDDLSLHRNRKLKGMLPLRSTRRSALLCVLLIDSKNPWNPPQVCYCSGSGTCNRSEICFSFFRFFLDFPLSVCHVIPQSALNYLPRCSVSWDRGRSVLLSSSCCGDSSVIAEISEQNENITGFIRFRVLTDSSRLLAATCSPWKSGDGRLAGSELYSHIYGIVTRCCWIFSLETSMQTQNSAAFKETSNEGQFYLGVYWLACLCVKKAVFVISDFCNITANDTKSTKEEGCRCWPMSDIPNNNTRNKEACVVFYVVQRCVLCILI